MRLELDGQVNLCISLRGDCDPEQRTCGGRVAGNSTCDAALMIHVMTGVPIPNGCMMIPAGGTGSASSDEFHITVRGKGGHGAMPNLSVDPINAMAHIHLALQEINARELAPGEYLVITPGTFHAGTCQQRDS